MKKFAIMSLVILLAAGSLSGCMSTRSGRGAVYGGGIGAVAGGLATGRVGGVVAGGAIGAVAGYLIGGHSYSCRKTGLFGNHYRGICFR